MTKYFSLIFLLRINQTKNLKLSTTLFFPLMFLIDFISLKLFFFSCLNSTNWVWKNSKFLPKEKRLKPKKKVTTYLGKIESGQNRIGFKLGTVRFGFGLSIFGSLRVGSLWSSLNWPGHFRCESFRVLLQFGFHSVLNWFTSDVWVQIDSSYF